MSFLFEAVEPLSGIIHHFNRYDEDSVDRLNYKYSTVVFTLLAIVATTHTYVGEPIRCWAPHEFEDHWIEYTNSICWISNTYYIPLTELNILEARRKEVVYYQWVPLVLFAQALMFYLPCVHWTILNRSIGMDIHKIGKTCRDIELLNPDTRDKATRFLVKHLDRSLKYSKELNLGACSRFKSRLAKLGCFCGKRQGNFLIVAYLMTKLLYIGNICLQMYMLNHFLGTQYTIYGLEILKDIKETGGYKESLRFPRQTLCDFERRTMARNIPYTVQCVLPINLFNEKIFIFVWFWLAFMGIVNVLSLLSWLWIAFTTNRRGYVRKYLKVFGKYEKENDRERLIGFCDKYLRQDGHFAFRMISKNTNGEMITCLWDFFGKNYNYHRKITV